MKRKILITLIVIVVAIEILKRISPIADFYASDIYPIVSHVLHAFSSMLPFSLYDMLIPALFLMLGIILWKCIKRAWGQALFLLSVTLLLAWTTFQLSWGINYFRSDFYARTGLSNQAADSLQFMSFADAYIKNLNESYPHTLKLDTAKVHEIAGSGFDSLCGYYKLSPLPGRVRVKQMTSGDAYAKVGVLGYYGPFFSEVHVNNYLKPQQYPFVVTHEIAHLAGVTSEAEANFYAYEITRHSEDSLTRFSAYYSLLPHVLNNAQRVVSAERYKEIISKIDTDIIALHVDTRDYWNALYSDKWGRIQDKVYDMYLKNNNIPDGKANYSEVIGMILASGGKDSIP
ncbi:MAG: DUF3810 domain-containing protein [Bacteroidales bacterium]